MALVKNMTTARRASWRMFNIIPSGERCERFSCRELQLFIVERLSSIVRLRTQTRTQPCTPQKTGESFSTMNASQRTRLGGDPLVPDCESHPGIASPERKKPRECRGFLVC